jgi:hypothetical protein
MTGVMFGHSATPMLPSIVHGRVHPISGNGCRGGGPTTPVLARGPYTSLG